MTTGRDGMLPLLRAYGVRSVAVLEAMGRVPREDFVLPEYRDAAYADNALPIECDQTISQPLMVAIMTEALSLPVDGKVLEIGTGSGYQAAVLAELSQRVVTIERHERLSVAAAQRLAALGYQNVKCVVGDGAEGYLPESPYERILITAATRECPAALWDQLAEGGILVGPFGGSSYQELTRITKMPGGQRQEVNLGGCRFVPFVSRHLK